MSVIPGSSSEGLPESSEDPQGPLGKSSSSGSLSKSGVAMASSPPSCGGSAWPNSPEDYELREVIGVGATAVVHAALCKPRSEKCAIKRINLEKWNTSMDELLKEIQAMSSCNHENVVTYFTSFVYKEELWLVLRLLNSGSLLDIIRHKLKTQDCKTGVLDELSIATVLKEVLKGLEYLHNNGHIHRDIKAGNILLGSEGQVQIADFGVSAWLVTGGDMNRAKSRHTFVGTPCWMAPEVMEQVTGYDYKADIWSFGITAVELATGTAPYHKYPPMKVLMLTLQNDPPSLDTNAEDKEQYKAFGKTFRKMISECLQKDPSKRPTATELLKHQFFKSKAKDRKFLQQNLIASAPTIDSRSQKIRNPKRSGTSGRLHKNTEGDWVWSSDDDDDEDDDDEEDNDADGDDDENNEDEDESDGSKKKKKKKQQPPSSTTTITTPQEKQGAASSGSSTASKATDNATPTHNTPNNSQSAAMSQKTLNLVLRMRNPKRELNDIRFEYQPSKDTAEGIANELLGTGLIGPDDLSTMAVNLKTLVSNPPPNRVITFRVMTGFNGNEQADEKALLGFAQLSLTE